MGKDEGVRVGLRPFSLANINEVGRPSAKVDGLWVQMVDAEIRRVIADMEDRPGLDERRKVRVELVFSPVTDDRGVLEDIEVYLTADASIPKQQSRPFAFRPAAGAAEMLFSPAHSEGSVLYAGSKHDRPFGEVNEGSEGDGE